MTKAIDIIGKKFGKLVVIKRVENTNQGRSKWLCQCDCGNLKSIIGYDLISGKTKSCGCIRKEKSKERGLANIKHNKTNTRLYKIWSGMKSRCYYIKNIAYKDYGGRGIKIYDEWKKDFVNFYNWAINNGYNDNLTIDRIDVNGNYEPNNCRWVTIKVQENNRRNNKIIKYKENFYTLSELAEKLNISSATLNWRLNHNWNEEELNLKVDLANSKIRKEMNFKNE